MEDGLKPLQKLTAPSPINLAIDRLDLAKGTISAKTIAEHHADITATRLPAAIPDDVSFHFDIARNLLLYSWFVWEFRPASQLYAYATLEMALRAKARQAGVLPEEEIPGLKGLLRLALERGWLDVTTLSEYKIIDANQKAALDRWDAIAQDRQTALDWAPQVDPRKYAFELGRYMPFVRNDLAHGSTWTPGNPIGTLIMCRELIIQLFGSEAEAPGDPADA